MKAAISIVVILLSGGACAIAQENLIRNWSFEQVEPNINGDTLCFGCGGCVYMAEHWNSAWGSVDYFNACSNEDWPLWGVPVNTLGQQRPFEGLAYAGIATYSEVFSEAREFLWQELELPLKPGQTYRFSMHLSLMDSAEWATNSIGALFTVDDPRFWTNVDSYYATTSQINFNAEQMTDKVGWSEIAGYFIALGGEKFMTIGNFLEDANSELFPIKVDTFSDVPNNWEFAAYYIDAITLHEVSGLGLEEQLSNDNEQLTVWPNPSDQEFRATHTGRQGMLVLRELTGRVVAKTPASNESTVVSTLDVANGIYLLEFIADTGPKWHQRVVVRHR